MSATFLSAFYIYRMAFKWPAYDYIADLFSANTYSSIVTSARWQCHPMWHVSFYSGEAGCKLQYSIYFTFTLQCFDAFAFSVLTCVRACVTLQCNRLQHLSGLWCCYFCQMLAGIMFWPVCVSKVTQKVEWIFLKVGEQVMIHHRGVNSILEVIGNIFWALVCHICHHTTTDGLHIEPGDFVDCTPAAVLVQWSVQY